MQELRQNFNYVVGPVLCPACREKLEEKFQEVKEYIRDHKGVGIMEVSEACDVDAAARNVIAKAGYGE